MTVQPLPKTDRSGGRTCITSPFGKRWGGSHNGTDEGSTDGIEIGTPEYANDAGVIERVGRDPGEGAGINIWLRTDRVMRNASGRLCTVGYKYFHMNGYSVSVGQRVKEGQQVGEVGNTGTGAAHLHQQMHLLDGLPGEWTDRTAVSHTAELQWLIDNNFFVGSNSAPPTTPTPEDDMPSMDELKKELVPLIALEIAASEDRLKTSLMPPDEKWRGTYFPTEEDMKAQTNGRVYLVNFGKKYWIPGSKAGLMDLFDFLGYENRGIQGIGNSGALAAFPEGAWDENSLGWVVDANEDGSGNDHPQPVLNGGSE